jgi:WXG100 family type VII secretion target
MLMEQTAKQFEAADSELQVVLRSMQQKVADLQAAWVGRGAGSFQQTMEAWSRDQDSINRLLAETAQLIRSAGQEYATSDANTASRFTGQEGGAAPSGSQ